MHLPHMETHKLDFWTSHQQFYIADKTSPFETDSDDFWTEEATNDRLAIEQGIIGIATECYGDVKGVVEVLTAHPEEQDLKDYDHVVEGSLELKSGVLQGFPCLDKMPVLELNLSPRVYRIRVYSSNLKSVVDDSGDDYYLIRIWPMEYMPRLVLKQYTSANIGFQQYGRHHMF
jgi:hypothetical protein